MICKVCGSRKQSRVLESREREKFVMRRRRCEVCGYTFLTHEIFVRGEMPIDGPRVLYWPEVCREEEAIWLEIRGKPPVATAVKSVGDTSTEFGNGLMQINSLYRKQWRVWNLKPSEMARRDAQWE